MRRLRHLAPAAVLLPAALAAAGGPALGQQIDPQRAVLEARIQQLEETVRQLTGRIEQLEYQEGQLGTRFDRLVGSVDDRLRGGEGALPRQAAAGAASPAAPALRAPLPPPEPPASRIPGGQDDDDYGTRRLPSPGQRQAARDDEGDGDVEPDAAAGRGYVLGTIPRDAARNPPTPEAAPSGPAVASRQPPAAAGDAGYDGALKLLQSGRWTEAQQAFQAFVDKSPGDPRVPSAAYWLGETYYVGKDYQNAAATFARNYKTYGAGAAKAPDNLLKLGMSLAALGQKDKACLTFAELAKRHANAPAAVKQALARERAADGCAAG